MGIISLSVDVVAVWGDGVGRTTSADNGISTVERCSGGMYIVDEGRFGVLTDGRSGATVELRVTGRINPFSVEATRDTVTSALTYLLADGKGLSAVDVGKIGTEALRFKLFELIGFRFWSRRFSAAGDVEVGFLRISPSSPIIGP
jgi:hypothetical protein